jgi:hypothetical protein
MNADRPNLTDDSYPETRPEPVLMPPSTRRLLLDLEIARLLGEGFRIDTRSGHHVVMCGDSKRNRRVEIFVDEFGELLRS